MVVKGIVFLAAALTVAFGVVALAHYQSSSVKRTPTLTTEDVVASKSPSGTSKTEYTGGPISWQHNMDSALQQAQANDGLVIVDIYTDWCGWCKRMDSDIYSAPAVAALSRKDVFLKLNAEDGSEGQAFARKCRVSGYPTTIILNSRGEVVKSAAGYLVSPENFLRFVESARAS